MYQLSVEAMLMMPRRRYGLLGLVRRHMSVKKNASAMTEMTGGGVEAGRGFLQWVVRGAQAASPSFLERSLDCFPILSCRFGVSRRLFELGVIPVVLRMVWPPVSSQAKYVHETVVKLTVTKIMCMRPTS